MTFWSLLAHRLSRKRLVDGLNCVGVSLAVTLRQKGSCLLGKGLLHQFLRKVWSWQCSSDLWRWCRKLEKIRIDWVATNRPTSLMILQCLGLETERCWVVMADWIQSLLRLARGCTAELGAVAGLEVLSRLNLPIC